MKETRRNLLVGLFMICGLGVLGVLMVMFGEVPSWLGGAEYELRIRVREIAGVDEGTPIYLNGIKIGRVDALNFINMSAPEKGVEVIGKIEQRFNVPRGARAQCVGPALGLGRGRIEIYAEGEGVAPLDPGSVIRGVTVNPLSKIFPETMMGSLESTVKSIGEFAQTLTPVAEDLHVILKETPLEMVDQPGQQFTANLHTAIQRLDRVLKHIDQVLGDPEMQNNLLAAIENVRLMSEDGRAAFSDLKDTSANLKTDASQIADKVEVAVVDINEQMNGALRDIRARVNEIAAAAMPVLENSARTTSNLRLITQNLLDGQGTLGKLLTDNRLYEILVLSLERAKDFIDSLRRLGYRFEQRGRIGLDVGGIPVDRKIPE